MIFLGTYFHHLDSKNRLSLPAKFTSKLGDTIVISKGFEGCLEIRSVNEFEKYADSLMKLTQTKKDTRIVIRQLLANAADLNLDKINRILIPNNLLKEAKIQKDTAIIGIGNKIEVWDLNTYNKFKLDSDRIYEEISEKLTEKNND